MALINAFGDIALDASVVDVKNAIEAQNFLTDAQLRASAVPVSLPNQTNYTYTFTGVIANNTDVLVIDCQGLSALSIQCTSMGSSGVVTPNWSNNNSTYVATSLITPQGTGATTFNAAGMWTTPVLARYLRLRMTTATTSGTTTITVQGMSNGASIPVAQQPITGSVSISGTPTVTLVTPATTFVNSTASTNAAAVKASAGTVWSITVSNTNAAARYLKLYNRTTAPTVGTDIPVIVVPIPATGAVTINGGANGIRFSTGIAMALTTGMADNDTGAVAAGEIKVAVAFT